MEVKLKAQGIKSSKLQKPEPKYFRERLHAMFVAHLLKRPDFDERIASAREKWKLVESESYDVLALRAMDFSSLPRTSPEMDEYIHAVELLVGVEFRCREKGQAAPWVCKAVHGAVTGGDSY